MSSLNRDAVFAAIADPLRREILRRLHERPSDVERLAAHFPVSRPAVSKHLSALRKAGLVTCTTHGRANVYAASPEPLHHVEAWLEGFWDGRLAMLKRLAEGDS